LVSLSASCWQGALYGARSSDSCILVRLISLEEQLVKLLISNSRHVVWYKWGSLRIGEQETYALGWALARRTTVKCSLEDSKSLFLKRCCHWGIPLSLTAVGVVRKTRWGLVHRSPNGEGRRSFRRTRSPGLTEIVIGWGRIWSVCSLRSSLRRLR
jgi:hypothetical protein